MEHSGQEEGKTEITLLLVAVAWLSSLLKGILDNYDDLFKILTVISLCLIIIVNIGKAVSMFKEWFNNIRKIFSKKKENG